MAVPRIGEAIGALRGGGAFTARPFLLGTATFLGAGGLWVASPDSGTTAGWLASMSPTGMKLAASFVGGFLIGCLARTAIKLAALLAAVAVAVIAGLAKLGVDISGAEAAIDSSVTWVGANAEYAQAWLLKLLPSASAAGAGGFLGFRRR
jgi:uncharacterized membrane protein (Fun14 family)